jgi:CHAD domain-containing protein
VKGVDLPTPHELLADQAPSGARRVALALLEAAVVAKARLDDPEDVEALHDFRVALRRTRSWVKALDDELGDSVRKKHRRRLSSISRAAGEARDAQVHATWLRDVEDTLRPRERPGVVWLLQRVVENQKKADAEFRAVIAKDFDATAAAMLNDLAVYTVRVDLRNPATPPTLGQVLAPLIRAQVHALSERLAAVQSIQDQAVAHAARIAGKRLRYLLEPVAEGVEGGSAVVKRLRILQDIIGEMHDVHVMAEEVIQASEDAGANQARRVATALLEGDAAEEAVRLERTRDPRPGLLAIAAQLRSRGESAFGELQQHWLGDHARDLPSAVQALADRLASGGSDQPDAPPTDALTISVGSADRSTTEADSPAPVPVRQDQATARASDREAALETHDDRAAALDSPLPAVDTAIGNAAAT